MNSTTQATGQAGQVYGEGQFDGQVEDLTARTARDISALFAGLRTLGYDDAQQMLDAIRRQADDLEVEMMGGEPEDDGRDSAAGYMLQEAF